MDTFPDLSETRWALRCLLRSCLRSLETWGLSAWLPPRGPRRLLKSPDLLPLGLAPGSPELEEDPEDPEVPEAPGVPEVPEAPADSAADKPPAESLGLVETFPWAAGTSLGAALTS